MYARGLGVQQDKAEAARWLRLAADQGHALAQHNLRFMVRMRMRGKLKWIVLAAAAVVAVVWIGVAKGDAEAQFDRGQMYFEGEGVPKDFAEAARSFRLAAAQSHTQAAWQSRTHARLGVGCPQE